MAKVVFKDFEQFISICNTVAKKQFNDCLDGKAIKVEEEIIFTEGDTHDRT